MDGSGEDWMGWSADGVAAAILGAAIGTALLLLGWPLVGVGVAAVSALATLALLRQVKPEPRRFRLRSFALPPVAVVTEAAEVKAPVAPVLELVDVLRNDDAPLVLEDRLDPPQEDSRVVQLFAARALPTPGELRQRIEAHLGERQESRPAPVLELEVDAAAALRQALGDLRRNLA